VLDTAQSIGVLAGGTILIVLLLRILMLVHAQTNKVKELEQRMKLMEKETK
jgi:hypothetical protein